MSATAAPLAEFAQAVPPPLLSFIVEYAPLIAAIRWAAQTLCWKKGRRVDGCIVLAAWWAACLFGGPALKYGIPLLILVPALVRSSPRSKHPPLATEQTVQAALADLNIIRTLLPRQLLQFPAVTISLPIRSYVYFFVPYLGLAFYISANVLVALLGTIALTWRAGWSRALRRAITRSAWTRRLWFAIQRRIQGLKEVERFQLTSKPGDSSEIRILFTVYENQRWWMGLDWTSALLPAERPSWCTQALRPTSSPTSFTLPPPVSSYLTHPEDARKRVHRRATWHWEEPDWRVMINSKESGAKIGGVASHRPSSSLSNNSASPTSEKVSSSPSILDGKGPIHEAVTVSKNSQTEDHHISQQEDGIGTSQRDGCPTLYAEKNQTDSDGWVYGDNKWENPSPKGGLGKYTRFRRWTRIAVLSEDVEDADAGSLGIITSKKSEHSDTDANKPSNFKSLVDAQGISSKPPGSATDRLRQRLKAVIKPEASNDEASNSAS